MLVKDNMKNDKDSLGNRMKENYEDRSKNYLIRRIPVIIRIDGKSFHTFCKRFKKPYDEFLNNSLNEVMLSLCKRIQGAKMAERHSDEISIVLTDYDTIDTDSFFDYNVQKVCSVVASMATAEFCKQMTRENANPIGIQRLMMIGELKVNEDWPCFDARCFNVPESEVANYFWWRLIDAKRNSINMLAQSLFSHKELQGLTCDQMQELMFQKKGINWGKLEGGRKAGFIAVKEKESKPAYSRGPVADNSVMVERNIWKAVPSPETVSKLRVIIEKVLPKTEKQKGE